MDEDFVGRIKGDICISWGKYANKEIWYLQMHAGLPGSSGFRKTIPENKSKWRLAWYFLQNIDKRSNKRLIEEKTGIECRIQTGDLIFLGNYFARSEIFNLREDFSKPHQPYYILTMKQISPTLKAVLERYKEVSLEELALLPKRQIV